MINVNGLKRNAKNIVKKYSDAQIKVREATSNDPWGPSSTIMAQIADLTYNVVAFSEIMQMIWKRLNDHDKNWRHVYKALVLLEYLIKTGAEKVAQQCTENIFAIQTLKDFQYMDDNKDLGMNIREKSKKLVALLKDSEKLKAERARALKAKARLAESMSSESNLETSMASDSIASGSSSSGMNMQDSGLAGLMNPDLVSARPLTASEEENQLRLALALSKKEAEQQEKTRKNDELRLKLALDVSKTTAAPNLLDDFNTTNTSGANSSTATTSSAGAAAAPSKSTIDDLLGLTMPAPSENQSSNNAFPEPQNDPWSSDPWASTNGSGIGSSKLGTSTASGSGSVLEGLRFGEPTTNNTPVTSAISGSTTINSAFNSPTISAPTLGAQLLNSTTFVAPTTATTTTMNASQASRRTNNNPFCTAWPADQK